MDFRIPDDPLWRLEQGFHFSARQVEQLHRPAAAEAVRVDLARLVHGGFRTVLPDVLRAGDEQDGLAGDERIGEERLAAQRLECLADFLHFFQ